MYIEWKNGKPYDKDGEEIQFLSDRTINELHQHLDTAEEYERDSIAVDYGDFLDFMADCASVYATTNDNEKYLSDWGKTIKLFPYRYLLMHQLARGIQDFGFNIDLVPLIPMVEYKLVPTGRVVYYDPTMNEYDRKMAKIEERREIKYRNRNGKNKNVWQIHAEEILQAQIERGHERGLQNKGYAHAKKGEKRIKKDESR